MLRVYLASPISQGSLRDNIHKATTTFHVLRRLGMAPFCPALTVFSGECWEETDTNLEKTGSVLAEAEVAPDETDGMDWMLVDLPWVLVSDCVLRLPGPSRGADVEVLVAMAKGIPVFTSIDTLKQWAATKEPLQCRS